jgi:hypothetical protein
VPSPRGLFGAVRRRGIGQTLRLLGNIVDQGLSSLTNLMVSLFSAHLLRVETFGVVGLAMATYFICVGIGRATVGDPLLLSPMDPAAAPRSAVDPAFSAAFCLGLLFTAASLVALLVAGASSLVCALLVLGAGLPFLLLQDIARYIAFWSGRPWEAAANDLLWLLGSLASLSMLRVRGDASPASVMACWVVSGAVAGLVFAVRRRWRPSVRAAWSWVRENRQLILPLLGDYGLIALLQQGVLYVVTAIAGLRATAAFRGAQVALGPVNVLTAGVSVFLVQLARRTYDASPGRFPRVMFRRSTVMAGAVLGLCIGVYLMPDALGHLLLDDVWYAARPLVLPMGFVLATTAINFGATTGLRVIGEAARGFRVRVVAAPVMLAAVAAACYTGGVVAAVVAQVVAGSLATCVWWWVFVRAHRRVCDRRPA